MKKKLKSLWPVMSRVLLAILRFLWRVIKWPFRNANVPTSPLARTL